MESTFPSQNLRKRPMCNIHQNGWRITWGTQPERMVLRLKSRSYDKSHPSPKAYCFSNIVDKKYFLVVSNPCLTFLDSACISFTLAQVYSLVAPIIESHRYDFTSAFSWSFRPVGARASPMLNKYHIWCRANFEPCCHDLTWVLVYPSWSIIQTNGVSDHVWSSFWTRSLYPGRRCHLSTSTLQEVIFDPEHLTKLLGQEDWVMKRNKQSPEAQLDSTMASGRSLMEGKVAWVTKKSFLLSTILIPDILLAIQSIHRSSFLVLPLLS
jgi:hypothetical protein